MHAFCSPQKVSRFTLGRSPGLDVADCLLPVASPSPADTLSGCSKRRVLTDSGGTAPDSHRSSLLCPSWAPEALTFIPSTFHAGQVNRPDCRHVDSVLLAHALRVPITVLIERHVRGACTCMHHLTGVRCGAYSERIVAHNAVVQKHLSR